MFQNSYQNGTHFDLFDPKGRLLSITAPQEKTRNLYRMINVHSNNKIFDKLLKTYVLQFTNSTSKICFPREEKKDLYLIQQYLCLQIYLYPQMSWNIELVISDHTKTKRRIILSSATNKLQIKPFFIKFPSQNVQEGAWNNLSLNLFSFMEAFKSQQYRSLDSIYITGHFKLRRIFTTPSQICNQQNGENKQISFLPKNFHFPPDVPSINLVINYDPVAKIQSNYEPTQPSTKNSSHMVRKTQNRISSPKSELICEDKNIISRHFLANTNGSQMNRKIGNQKTDSDHSPTQKCLKTPKSTSKNLKNKKLIKTQVPKPKVTPQVKRQEKTHTKAKLNPWRNNSKQQNDLSQLQITKNQSRNLESSQTTLFKTKNNLASKFNDSKNKGFGFNSNYSDSQYVELSQKFSTMTDGKLLRQQGNNQYHKQNNDQIQQNIEMETNSIYSNSNKKQQTPYQINQIVQSICDSLDKSDKFYNKIQNDDIYRNSHYGFGENLMRKYMGQIQRPYSPPLGQRQKNVERITYENQNSGSKEQLELMYDPTLNCYYDHKTHTYYELKS